MKFKDLPPPAHKVLIDIQSMIQNLSSDVNEIKRKSVHVDGYYTSNDVKERLQISDEKLASMREKNEIVYRWFTDKLYRYPIDQEIFNWFKPKSKN